MCHKTHVLYFHTVTSFDLTLTCAYYYQLLIWYLHHSLSSTLAEFVPASVSELVSTADKAGRVSFDLLSLTQPRPDM